MHWIYSRVNKVSVIGLGGSARKNLFIDIFTHIFTYFPHFTVFSCVEQIKICLLRGSYSIDNTKVLPYIKLHG